MAKFDSVNQLPATGAVAIYQLKTLLVSAGWVVKSSSDGTTYNSTGDQISSGGSGTGGLGNNHAWFRIQDPGTRREFIFQRGTNNTDWRAKFSESAKFTGGSPGATQTPSATDEGYYWSSGNDATPTYTTLFGPDATYRFHVVAFSDVVATNVYSFFAFSSDLITAITRTQLYCDGLSNTHSLDTSPVALFSLYKTIAMTPADYSPAIVGAAGSPWRAFYRHGLSGALFTNFRAPFLSTTGASGVNIGFQQSFGANPYDSGQDIFKFLHIYRPVADSTATGWKGTCIRMAHGSQVGRYYPNWHSPNSANSMVYVNEIILVPWPDNTAPVL
jgi:hypothetical protein